MSSVRFEVYRTREPTILHDFSEQRKLASTCRVIRQLFAANRFKVRQQLDFDTLASGFQGIGSVMGHS